MLDARYADSWVTEWVRSGRLPTRYGERWAESFDALIHPLLEPDMRVLDIGAGRHPTLSPQARSRGTGYVGLDVSSKEMAAAPDGAYDDALVGDITKLRPELCDGFDLVVSWQALEHVRSLRAAFDNAHAYLRPGGRMVALFSGRWSIFALLNRLVPQRLGERAMARLLDREPKSVFAAYYDDCYYAAIADLGSRWASAEIQPKFCGASYFAFSYTIMRAYLAYENLAVRRRYNNLATHYLVSLVR
ncbi:MAG: class I SAM-dependent methyltransferase [Actinomycetota bacterium]